MTTTVKSLASLACIATILSVATVHGQTGGQQLTISSIIGLANQLAIRPTMGVGYETGSAAVIDGSGELEAAVGNSSDCVHVDGASAPCVSGTATGAGTNSADAEVPNGSVNGSNQQFTLASAPSPSTSAHIYLNGLRLSLLVDYTISGNVITFVAAAVPQSGDLLRVDYRY